MLWMVKQHDLLLVIFAPALFCIASYACICVVGSIVSTFTLSLHYVSLTSHERLSFQS